MILVIACSWLVIVSAVFLISFAVFREVAVRRRKRRAEALDRMRPVAIATVFEDEPPDIANPSRREAVALSFLVSRLSRQVRGGAREHLAQYLGDSGFVDDQLRELHRRSPSHRGSAAFTLGDVGNERAVPALVEALGDRDRGVRIAAARSLGALRAVEAAEPLLEALRSARLPWIVGGQALIDIGAPAGSALRAVVTDPDAGDEVMRGRAVELLGMVGGGGDAPIALDALADGSPAVRERAARALGRLGSSEAVGALERALDDEQPSVAAAAATALGRLGEYRSLGPLLSCARAAPFEAARAAARAAVTIDADAVATAAADAVQGGDHLLEAAQRYEVRADLVDTR